MNVQDLVMAELARATTKFPTWPTDPLHALAVLGEEFGELTKAMLQMTYEPHKTSTDEVRTEAVQTAAMAMRLAMSLDAYQYRRAEQHQQQQLAPTAPQWLPTEAQILAACEEAGLWPNTAAQWVSNGAFARYHAAINRMAPSAQPASTATLTQAVQDVLAERRRQIEVEGWTPKHDDEHGWGDLADAAACYISGSPYWSTRDKHQRWPWELAWWKPKDRRTNLVRSAALLMAEVERMDRADAREQQP